MVRLSSVSSRLTRLLIAPLQPLPRLDDQRRSAVMGAFALILTLAVIIEQWMAANTPRVLVFVLAAMYFLARTRYYKQATLVLLVSMCLPSFIVVPRMDVVTSFHLFSALAWLALPILISSLVYTPRATAMLCAAISGAILLLPLTRPDLPLLEVMGPFGFIITLSAVILVVMHQRNRIEDDRQTELQRSQQHLKLALEAAHLGTWDWTIATNQVTWSDQVEAIFGLPAGGFGGTYDSYQALVYPEDVPILQQAIEAALSGKLETFLFEHRICWSDDSLHWLESHGRVYHDAAGQPLRMVGTVTDITQRKQAVEEINRLNAELEQRVRERTAELEAANNELESFSYSVSHDLRAPLRAINGYANILQEDHIQAMAPDARDMLGKILLAGRHMAQLIDELLALSRLGRKPLNIAPVDLNQLVRLVIDSLETETAGRQIEWQVEVLPQVNADAILLQQVLVNLIGNAVKYTGKQPAARIHIGSTSQDTIFVRDNGVGFDMKYMDKLFKVFNRLHHEEEFEGSGIGLATAQRILQRHGGRIWAEAQLNQGATFYFTLPR